MTCPKHAVLHLCSQEGRASLGCSVRVWRQWHGGRIQPWSHPGKRCPWGSILPPPTKDKFFLALLSFPHPEVLALPSWLWSSFREYRAKAAPGLLEGCQGFTVHGCFHAMTTESSNHDRTAPHKVWSVYYLAFPESGCQPRAVTEQSTVTIFSSSLTIWMEQGHKLEFAVTQPLSSRWEERRETEEVLCSLTNMYSWLPFLGHWPAYSTLFPCSFEAGWRHALDVVCHPEIPGIPVLEHERWWQSLF